MTPAFISPLDLIQRHHTQRTADVAEILPPRVTVSGAEAVARLLEGASARPAAPYETSEAERILGLPSWDPATFKVDLTDELKTPTGTMKLSPVQSLALYWARKAGGLIAPLAVGTGKTAISLLAGRVMGARRPLLLIPTDAQNPLRREIEKMRPHWQVPLVVAHDTKDNSGALRILPYSQLSLARGTDILDKLQPDVVIADECHSLRYMSSARAKRVIRYFKSYPETRFVGLSGTVTSKGLRDYAHLCELALRNSSPVPLKEADLIAWANVIDADAVARSQDIRAFEEFCPNLGSLTEVEIAWALQEIDAGTDTGRALKRTGGQLPAKSLKRAARNAFRERFVRTVGVVATTEGSVQCSLKLRERALRVPDVVQEALDDLNATWTRPDGEELVTALDKWRCAAQLSQGFYYRWVWPDNVVDTEWMGYRSWWHREVREVLKKSFVGLDSPLLVTRAVSDLRLNDLMCGACGAHQRHEYTYCTKCNAVCTGKEAQAYPLDEQEKHALISAWTHWSSVSEEHPELPPPNKRPKPPTETVWLDAFLIEDALEWRKEHPKGLIWFDDRAVEAVLRLLGVETYGGGEDPPEDGRGMALSINAFKQVRNLQKNSENLMLSWQSSGQVMEQAIGRTHRQGQEADEVLVDFYNHTDSTQEALTRSRNDAEYLQQTQGSPQKLVYATWIEKEA